jgi:hypothetical protein
VIINGSLERIQVGGEYIVKTKSGSNGVRRLNYCLQSVLDTMALFVNPLVTSATEN